MYMPGACRPAHLGHTRLRPARDLRSRASPALKAPLCPVLPPRSLAVFRRPDPPRVCPGPTVGPVDSRGRCVWERGPKAAKGWPCALQESGGRAAVTVRPSPARHPQPARCAATPRAECRPHSAWWRRGRCRGVARRRTPRALSTCAQSPSRGFLTRAAPALRLPSTLQAHRVRAQGAGQPVWTGPDCGGPPGLVSTARDPGQDGVCAPRRRDNRLQGGRPVLRPGGVLRLLFHRGCASPSPPHPCSRTTHTPSLPV